jgi:hypothetical protein
MPMKGFASASAGINSATVRFMNETRTFETAIDGYIWLLNRFVAHQPKNFRKDREWLLRYLASSPTVLFYYDPGRAQDPALHVALTNGWCAKKSVSNDYKFAVLAIAGTLAGSSYPTNWDFRPTRPMRDVPMNRAARAGKPVDLKNHYPVVEVGDYGF